MRSMRRFSISRKLAISTGATVAVILVASWVVLWPREQDALYLLLVSLLTIGAVVPAVFWLTQRMVTRPLRALASTMSRAEVGDYLVRAHTRSNDEFGELGRAFNKMLAAITSLQATGIEQEQDLKLAHQELTLKQELEETNQRLEQRLGELSLLTDLTRAVTSTLELEAVLDEMGRQVGERMNVDEFVVLLFDRNRRRLSVASTHGVSADIKMDKLFFVPGEGISGRVAQSGSTILVQDTSADPRYLRYKGLRLVDGSFLSVPMIAKGQVLGVLDFFRTRTHAFDEHSVALFKAVAGHAALAIENAKLFQDQTQLAQTDPLTELPNRRSLQHQLEHEFHRARRFASPFSVLMIDVDHFKDFNDRHGHLMGDHVLKQVTRTLRRRLRRVDTLTRYGGEEFCVLLVETPLTRAIQVAEKLRQSVSNRTYARIRSDRSLRITVSIGVATLGPGMESCEALIAAADEALYMAKHKGRDQIQVHAVEAENAPAVQEPVQEEPAGSTD